jgi:light-regulated signal transduction histidine kinase (bacteriophytochrome)
MGKMIEHVLQYSRAGTKGVHVENVDAWDVVQDVLRDYAERIDERGVQMKVSCLPVVLYDRTMLYLVLANLISNAIKFSKKTDTAPLVEVFGKNTSMGHVSIVVRDHGIGIPVQYTEKILDMGFRLHHESEYAGFGYGLAIVRKILKRCGGELGIRSKLNEGSDFVVTLLAGKNTQT